MYMSTNEYYEWKALIEAANSSDDREALRQIYKQLVVKYGKDDDNVKLLYRLFRYSV